MHFIKPASRLCLKNWVLNMHQRVRLDLPFSKPSGSSCSRYWSSGSGSRSNSSSRSSSGTPRSTAHTNEHTINKKEKYFTRRAPNRKCERKIGRRGIFMKFGYASVEIYERRPWSSLGSIGGNLAHEMTG